MKYLENPGLWVETCSRDSKAENKSIVQGSYEEAKIHKKIT